MTTEQKLGAIREKCKKLIEIISTLSSHESVFIATATCTIVAIDLLTNDGTDYARYEPELKKLIAPWEGLL